MMNHSENVLIANKEIIQEIERGQKLPCKNKTSFYAIDWRNLKKLDEEISKNPKKVNTSVNHLGNTLLMHSVSCFYTEAVLFLLKKGADTTLTNNNGDTALHLLGHYGADASLVKPLVEHYADINAKNNQGYTPLMMATNPLHIDIMAQMIKNGAKIPTTYADKNGKLLDCYPYFATKELLDFWFSKAQSKALQPKKITKKQISNSNNTKQKER